MINQQLLDFIKQQSQKGSDRDVISKQLLANGWTRQDIEEGYRAIDVSVSTPSVNSANPYNIIPTITTKRKIHLGKKIFLIVILFLLIGGVFGYYYRNDLLNLSLIKYSFQKRNPIVNEINQQQNLLQNEGVEIIPTTKNEVTEKTTDCGKDIKCLTQASVNCKPAKVINSVIIDIFGAIQTTTSYLEIKGIESDKCVFYLKIQKIDFKFPANSPPQTAIQFKDSYKGLEGREGTCKFKTGDLNDMLERWGKGEYSTKGETSCKLELNPTHYVCKDTNGDFSVAECEGTYFERTSESSL